MAKSIDAAVRPIPDDLVTTELKNRIRRIKKNESPPDRFIFDGLQRAVLGIIQQTVYPSFLLSTDFVEYVSHIEQSVDAIPVGAAGAAGGTGPTAILASAVLAPTAPAPVVRTTLPGKISDSCADGNTNRLHPSNNNNNNTSSINNNSASNSKTDAAAAPIPRTLSIPNELPTLHEDSELVMSERASVMKTSTDRHVPKLSHEMLLVTQKGRLEVRPPG